MKQVQVFKHPCNRNVVPVQLKTFIRELGVDNCFHWREAYNNVFSPLWIKRHKNFSFSCLLISLEADDD